MIGSLETPSQFLGPRGGQSNVGRIYKGLCVISRFKPQVFVIGSLETPSQFDLGSQCWIMIDFQRSQDLWWIILKFMLFLLFSNFTLAQFQNPAEQFIYRFGSCRFIMNVTSIFRIGILMIYVFFGIWWMWNSSIKITRFINKSS